MGDHNFKNANRATTADKSHYRTSAFWAGIHFTGNGVYQDSLRDYSRCGETGNFLSFLSCTF
jgi:hypothetical protein